MTIFDRNDRSENGTMRGIGRLGKATLAAVVLALGVGGTGLAMAHGPEHDKGAKMQKWKNMSEQERRDKLSARVEHRLERMTSSLELTETQQGEIREIMTKGHERALSLFETSEDSQERRGIGKQLHQIKKETRAKVQAVLSEEQVAKAKSLKKQRRAERPQRMTERLDEKLDLSDEQKEQVEAILSEAQADIQNLRGDDGVAAKGKGHRGLKQNRGEVRKIMKGAADDVESVLTDEQAAEFSEIREKMRERRGHRRGNRGGEHGKRHKRGDSQGGQ